MRRLRRKKFKNILPKNGEKSKVSGRKSRFTTFTDEDSCSHKDSCEKLKKTTDITHRCNKEYDEGTGSIKENEKVEDVLIDNSGKERLKLQGKGGTYGRKRTSSLCSYASQSRSKRIRRQTRQVEDKEASFSVPSNAVRKQLGKKSQQNGKCSKSEKITEKRKPSKSSSRKILDLPNSLLAHSDKKEQSVVDDDLPILFSTRVNKESQPVAEKTSRKAAITQAKATKPKAPKRKFKTILNDSNSKIPLLKDGDSSVDSFSSKNVPYCSSDKICANSSPIPFQAISNDSEDKLASSEAVSLCPDSDDILASSQPIPLCLDDHTLPTVSNKDSGNIENPGIPFSLSSGDSRAERNSKEDVTDSTDSGSDILTNSPSIPFLLIDEDEIIPGCKEETQADDISECMDDSNYLPTPASNYKLYKYHGKLNSVDWSRSFTDLDDISLSDSDEELPEVLTPISHGHIYVGDTVWIKYKDYPFWPAAVKRRYIRTKRISVEFINPVPGLPHKHSLRYPNKKVLPFHHSDKDIFIKQGLSQADSEWTEYFKQAMDKVTSEINAKALQSLPQEELSLDCNSLGDLEPVNLCERFIDEKEANFPSTSTVERKKSSKRKKRKKENKNDSVIFMGSFTNDFEKLRYEKIKKRNVKLVEFCTSKQMKEYLMDILSCKKPSKRHKIYMGNSTKARDQLQGGFGPIADEDQMDDIMTAMCDWWLEAHKSNMIPDTNYIFNVWVPEGVIYALMKQKGYARGRAETMFSKGISMTKKEKIRMHNSMIEGAKNISEEDKKLYDERCEERIRAMMGDDAEDIVKSIKQPVKVKRDIHKYFK